MITGAILGVVGTMLQAAIGWGERKQASQATERELALQLQIQQAELAVVQAKVQGEKDVAQTVADGQISVAQISSEAAMYKDSQQSDKASYEDKVIDFLRGSVRPVITYGCVAVLAYFMLAFMTTDQAKQLMPLVTTMFVDLTATVVVWWFGGRFIKRG